MKLISNIRHDLFKFPSHLPNDIEDFINIYNNKFPQVIYLFEELSKKYFKKPKELIEFVFSEKEDLFKGFHKIKEDYNKSLNKDIKLYVDIDQRLHKLYCFKFWIINYGFCDGPLHDYYVNQVSYFSEILAVWDNIDNKESSILNTKRLLLHGKYKDLYLQEAFRGIEILEEIKKINQLNYIEKKLKKAIDNQVEDNVLYLIVDELYETLIENRTNKIYKKLVDLLEPVMHSNKLREDMLMFYNSIINAFKFEKQNLELRNNYNILLKDIDDIFDKASKVLSQKDYIELKICYDTIEVFKEAKDILGSIDEILIPFWSNILQDLSKMLNINNEVSLGLGAMFYNYIWYLPDEYKVIVMTPDKTKFDIKNI